MPVLAIYCLCSRHLAQDLLHCTLCPVGAATTPAFCTIALFIPSLPSSLCLSFPPSRLWILPFLFFLYALSPCCSLWSTGFLPFPSLLLSLTNFQREMTCFATVTVRSKSLATLTSWITFCSFKSPPPPLVRAQRPFIKTCLSR